MTWQGVVFSNVTRPLGEASFKDSRWQGVGGSGSPPLPRHAQAKKIPAETGIFQKRRMPLRLVHNVEHVLKHVYPPHGFFLVKRVEKLIDLSAAWVAVLASVVVIRFGVGLFQ